MARDGGVFAFGDAAYLGSMGGKATSTQASSAWRATPSGHGYWLVGSDGGIFAFGDAPYEGSVAGLDLAQPVLGVARTPTGHGYWLVAKDGGVFAEGDARFFGSLGGIGARRSGGRPGGPAGWHRLLGHRQRRDGHAFGS